MMEKFSELHPNVTFQDDSVADEAAYNNKLKTAIATGNLPNMWMQYGAASLVEYAKNGSNGFIFFTGRYGIYFRIGRSNIILL